MFSAVTLSRSPPRAETTMIATDERSRIWRHSSKPSTSGSIRSSSTMSGSSVSSSCMARTPSVETTVSKPLIARLDRIRSTMLGSSSTRSARVFAQPSATAGPRPLTDRGPCPVAICRVVIRSVAIRLLVVARPGLDGARRDLGGPAARRGRHLDREMDPELRPLPWLLQLDAAAVSIDDALGYGQPEPGARGGRPAPPHRLEGRAGDLAGHPDAIVDHADHDPALTGPGGADAHPGAGRIVADRVVQQVDEDLLQAVMVGPHDRQRRITGHLDHGGAGRGQACDGRVKHQANMTPVPLQAEDPRLDGGEVEEVSHEAPQPRGLRRDPVQEPLL